MSSYNGFNRAAQAYENEVPGDDTCICEPVVQCPNCMEVYLVTEDTATQCLTCLFEDGVSFVVEPYTREAGDTRLAEQGCPSHGWCGGCSSRKCEDCN